MKKEKVSYRVWLKPKDETGFWTRTKAVSPEEAIAHAVYHIYGATSHDFFEEKEAEKITTKTSSSKPLKKVSISRQLYLPGCRPSAMSL